MTTVLRSAPPLLVPGPLTSSAASLTAQTAFSPADSPSTPYVLHVSPIPSLAAYIFAASDDSLRLFSSATWQPLSAKITPRQKGVTSLANGVSAGGGEVFFTTARDGTVAGWDTRDLSRTAFILKSPRGAGYLSATQSSDGAALAVAAELHQHEATIDLWDLRSMSLVTTYTEAHSDDITRVAFHPSPQLPHLLLSASVDGLLNTYDVRIQDEDDSVLSANQFGTSLVDAGWMNVRGKGSPGDLTGVWGATTIETVQIWDAEDSSLIADLGDIRDVALQPWRSDFLISAHYNSSLDGLCLLTGTQTGDVAVINVADPQRWVLERVLPSAGGRTVPGSGHGHTDIVRCAHIDSQNSTIVTGGEDGQICLWRRRRKLC